MAVIIVLPHFARSWIDRSARSGCGDQPPGGFVKEQHIGICREDRCDTDLLFLAAAQHVGRPVTQVFDSQHRDNIFRTLPDFLRRQVKLERAKGNLIKDG